MKKITLYAIQNKYKNQAGMNLTPPPPTSQNSQIIIIIIIIIIFIPQVVKITGVKNYNS